MDSISVISRFISAPDGLMLHARCHGTTSSRLLPVVCLPGLARTADDFDRLAGILAGKHGRRVIAVDYRGRGQSGYDNDPANYSFPIELADVLAVLTALDALPAIFVGTSRGGILTMLLAAIRPTAIAGCVLNDIGPVIEPKGLMRIKGYVGCPSSGNLRLIRHFEKRGPGSSGLEFKRPAVGAASVGSRWWQV